MSSTTARVSSYVIKFKGTGYLITQRKVIVSCFKILFTITYYTFIIWGKVKGKENKDSCRCKWQLEGMEKPGKHYRWDNPHKLGCEILPTVAKDPQYWKTMMCIKKFPTIKLAPALFFLTNTLYLKIKFVCMNVMVSIFMLQLHLVIKVGLCYTMEIKY